MASHNDFGKLAEELATKFLAEKGYKILVKNYRYLKAEIDIIARFDNKIIVVEVKARATDAFMLPQETINKKKIRLIVSAANHFSEEYEEDLETRFDIISILPNHLGQLEITHIEDAFEAFDAN
ncbi:MAG: YraN family protein [Cloacibacterium sp.]|jgi:putative endonuclease|nr:YraN family protein [Cloacibacterium sp.]